MHLIKSGYKQVSCVCQTKNMHLGYSFWLWTLIIVKALKLTIKLCLNAKYVKS